MAGRPRTMLRRVEGPLERAEALRSDPDGTMPAKYRDRPASDRDLVASGWQSARRGR